jgi:glycosyltransferase involved in cell wall biosynthesis
VGADRPLRILVANDGIGDAGGVQSYLASVIPALAARGHAVAFLHLDRERGGEGSPAPAGTPHFCMEERGADAALADAVAWRPDVCFSHNMRRLDVERGLLDRVPVVKFMHGYFGTCTSGQKAHLFPRTVPCGRRFGAACLALYLPRRCGRLSAGEVLRQHAWAREQNALFGRYAALVTASGHMRQEYVRNGAPGPRVHTLPLFPSAGAPGEFVEDGPEEFRVLFLGRMTRLKGGDVLVRAAALASAETGVPVRLTLSGDGPQRAAWQALAQRLGVDADFPGWVDDATRDRLLRESSLLAVPSVWPEPFGLAGLEAAAVGLPAVAFDVGGVREWLEDGRNGWLVPGRLPSARALADALVRAARDPGGLRAMRRRARQVAESLSLRLHIERLERVLRSALRPPPSPAEVEAASISAPCP